MRRIAPAGEDRRTTGQVRARILFADDDDWLCVRAIRRLASDGYRVFDACSGDQALLLLAAMRDRGWPSDGVDLMMLDAHMPGRDGIDVLRSVRAQWWAVPVVVMAFPDPAIDRDAGALRARVLTKPFTLDELAAAVAHALDGRALGLRGAP